MSQAGGLALPATITLGKLWKTLSSGSLSRKPLPLLGGEKKRKKKGDREVAQRKCDQLVKSSPLKFLARKKKGKNSESKNSNEPSNFGGEGKGSPAEASGQAEPSVPGLPRVARPSPRAAAAPPRRARRARRRGGRSAGAEPADRGRDGKQPATEPRAGAGAAAGGRGEAGWGWGRR